MQSYLESRGGMFDEITFFGLQYIIKKHLIDIKITEKDVEEASKYWKMHFNRDLFNKEAWLDIATRLGGKLPVSIKAIPEGISIKTHNVIMLIENTDPKHFWITNYLETLLLQVWYPTTVATLSREIKKILHYGLISTGGNLESLNFMLHDFGFRGSSSVESASIGGSAHLVNFFGTDTFPACILNINYYNALMSGFSIPATEHSTITSWGKEHELDCYKNLLDSYPTGTIACVSDSYDIYNACKNLWGSELKSQIENRDGVLVIRPDSGDPKEVILNLLNILSEAFGFNLNKKGYKLLPSCIRIIQGDGVNHKVIKEVIDMLIENNWCTENVSFGIGGALLQKLDRDTQKFALKCCSVNINGIDHDVYKDPSTDHNKKSKKGRLKLIQENGEYKTVKESHPGNDELIEIFRNGELLVDQSFSEIRKRAQL